MLLLWVLIAVAAATELRIVIILPMDPSKRTAIPHVRPAVDEAIDTVYRKGELSRAVINLTVTHRDSRSSDVYAPIAAVEMRHEANLFLGPCQSFAIAAVARYAPVWDLPVITACGAPHNLGKKEEFQTLTRMLPPYNSDSKVLLAMFTYFGWRKFGVLWHRDLESYEKDVSDCYFQTFAIQNEFGKIYGANEKLEWLEKFDENHEMHRIPDLLREASLKVRSK